MQLTDKQKSQGWRIVKFGDVAQEVKASTKNPLAEGIERYIGLEHIDSESLRLARWGVTNEDYPKSFTKKFNKGDILFGRRRAYLKKAAIADFDGICTNNIIVMKPKDNSNMIPDLLPFVVSSTAFFDWAVKHSVGSIHPNVEFNPLAQFQFPLPPRTQQEKMLKIFEKIEDNFFLNQKMTDMSKKLIHSMLFEKIWNNTDYENIELQEIVDIKKGTSITKKQIEKGNIPVIAGGQFPAYYHNESNRVGKVITVSASGAYAGFINYFDIPIFASDCSTIATLESRKIDIKFLYHLLKSKQNYFYSLQVGGAQPHIYPKHICKIKIPLPSIKIQKQFVENLELLNQICVFIKDKNHKLIAIRSKYLKKIFEATP